MNKIRTAAAAALLGLLAACGGGGDGGGGTPVVNANAEGFWDGVTGEGDPLALLVTDDGKLWGFHLARSSGLAMILGTGSTQAQNYTANGKIFVSTSAGNAFSLNSTVQEKKTLQGNMSGGAAFSFKLDYDSSYEEKASLDDIKGTWVVESSSTFTTTISETGALTGYVAASGGRCDFSGSVTPHASKNYFRTTITFAGNCARPYAGTSTSGFALVQPAEAGEEASMLAASAPADGSFIFPLVGVRASGG
ncbi:hypothetical protein [Pigmentiphaga kullae]|uniref:Lipoprotein n=1 Tax=Pigmentiphaga kullae TaxID=151784 RepID=A0A4Q7NJI4_9BURK|nr:hypothetical protein [Pigmentiphaga kullae]RZS85231.1 hypothetical protein EV675_1254 [Pigmentiphaga kullae]